MAAAAALLCLVWLAASVARGETTLWDANIRQALHSISNPWMTRTFLAITFLGSQAFVIGMSACAAIALFWKRRRDQAVLIVIVMAGAELWLSLLKAHFHRQRPEAFFDVHLPPSYSFPSGHALLSFCSYGLLCALACAEARGGARWLMGTLGSALVLTIGVSRIYLGVHYPTDVVAGYLVAIAWTGTMAAIHARLATMDT